MSDQKSESNAAIATALRSFKGEAQLSVRVLSERTDIPTVTINRVLNNQRDISITQVYKLAEAMGVTVVQVIERAGKP